MWTRRELKEKGKRGFNRNYWKTVLVSLIALVVIGGASGGSWNPATGFISNGASAASTASGATAYSFVEESQEEILDDILDTEPDGDGLIDDYDYDDETEHFGIDSDEFQNFINEGPSAIFSSAFGIIMIIIFAIIFLIILAIAILIEAFLGNPLSVGITRFFVRNLNTEAEVKELAYGYDNSYLNVVKTMFFKGLYTFLWTLLLIIPGIIKSYEYRMIPYILSEHPEMPMNEVFAKSKAMMTGQKWKTFVLDLSFIGWGILSAMTLGLLGIFYVNPYRNMTFAALYETLEYGPEDGAAVDNTPTEVSAWTNETTY